MYRQSALIRSVSCILLFSILVSCSSKKQDDVAPVNQGAYPAKVKIEYRVTAIDLNILNSLTYTDTNREEKKLNEVVLPFSTFIEPTVNKGDKFNLNVLHTNTLDTARYSVVLEVWVNEKLQKTETQLSNNNAVVSTVGIVFE